MRRAKTSAIRSLRATHAATSGEIKPITRSTD
jgi:hypothetical protein